MRAWEEPAAPFQPGLKARADAVAATGVHVSADAAGCRQERSYSAGSRSLQIIMWCESSLFLTDAGLHLDLCASLL